MCTAKGCRLEFKAALLHKSEPIINMIYINPYDWILNITFPFLKGFTWFKLIAINLFLQNPD